MRRSLAVGLVALVCVLAGDQAYAGTACGPAAQSATAATSWQPDVRRAKRYAKRREGDVRFAIVGLNGHMRRFHAGRTAPAASVFKAMLLAVYLRQASVRDRRLRHRDKELLGPMIKRSDNEAATRVRDMVGRRRIERLARDARMRRFRYNAVWGLSRIAAGDQARYFYRFDRYVPERHERYARRLLGSIVGSQRWGVADARPDGWKLYFKGGWGVGSGEVNHQVAFLQRHRHRIALAILTEYGPSHDYGTRTLEGVAERLLRGLPRLPKGS
jgi:beta-lactamase class A